MATFGVLNVVWTLQESWKEVPCMRVSEEPEPVRQELESTRDGLNMTTRCEKQQTAVNSKRFEKV